MFEQVFRNIDDVLWKEAGCTTELDYVEQTSWLLFLKYLDDLEESRALNADLAGRAYTPIIDQRHRWGRWAAPKDAQGRLDHNRAQTGPDLVDYVNRELFPYLQGFSHLGSRRADLLSKGCPSCSFPRAGTRALGALLLQRSERCSAHSGGQRSSGPPAMG